jgi:hypothetical protein
MRRHNFDPISFIFGALFAAIGLTFLFGDADIGDLHFAVVWPLPLIVIGLLMLVTTIQRRTRDEPVPAAAGVPVRDDRTEQVLTPTEQVLTPAEPVLTPTDPIALDDDELDAADRFDEDEPGEPRPSS